MIRFGTDGIRGRAGTSPCTAEVALAIGRATARLSRGKPVVVARDPRPSGDDLDLTPRLAGCGDLLGIALLDHLVVGDDAITSIREYGWPAPTRE